MRISGNIQGVAGIYTNDKRISKVESVNKLDLGRDDIKISSKAKDYSVAMNALKNIPDISFCNLTGKDVVRHPLVQKIVQAYENYEEKNKFNKGSR